MNSAIKADITRFAAIAVGYLQLAIALQSRGELRELVLLLPVASIIGTFTDRGIGEYVLKNGISQQSYRERLRQLSFALVVGIFSTISTGTISFRWPQLFLFSAIMTTGLLQGYVDVILRAWLWSERSAQRFATYQLLANCIGAGLVIINRRGWTTDTSTVSALVGIPAVMCLALAPKKLKNEQIQEFKLPSLKVQMLGWKIAPQLLYTLHMHFGGGTMSSMAEYARGSYFVFGFAHVRALSRQPLAPMRYMILILAVAGIGCGLILSTPTTYPEISITAKTVIFSAVGALAYAVYLHKFQELLKA